MQNERATDDPNLQAGLAEIKEIMRRRGLAGAAMLISEQDMDWTHGLHAPWSALSHDPSAPLGFKFRANATEDGRDATERKVLGAMRTICHLCDWCYMTAGWMDDIKDMLRQGGIDFIHIPFGGKSIPRIKRG